MALGRSLVCLFLACFSVTLAFQLHQDSDIKCPDHEEFSLCRGHPVCQRNCTNYNKPIICPLICYGGCICKEGYARSSDGRCIRTETCPKSVEDSDTKCSEHEEFSKCDAHPLCQKNCTNYDKPIFCPRVCYEGCICKEGYVRSSEGRCIRIETCPKIIEDECPKNSHFDRCGAHPICQKNCTNYDHEIPCPRICIPGCVCDEGYVRGPRGECITVEKCPKKQHLSSEQDKKCPPNQEYSRCGANLICQKNCTNYDKPIPCPKLCVSGCVCKEGYVRSVNGICIRIENCPRIENHECPKNSHFDRCGANPICQKNCTNYQDDIPCPLSCVPGCVCDEGYVRGPRGDCITVEKCPKKQHLSSEEDKKCLPNEEYSLCGAYPICQKNCTNYDKPIPCPKICVPGCVCKEGYVRSANGICIRIENCPRIENHDCPKNSHFDRCGAHPICQKNCTNYDHEFIPCPRICIPGCVCDEGYVRGPRGYCIPVEKCPKEQHLLSEQVQKCPQNESYTRCDAHPLCQKNCTNYDQPIPCPSICLPGCVCKIGYVRSEKGECIRIEDCPKRENTECPKNSHFDRCGANPICQKNCTNYQDDIIPCPLSCVPGCVCDEGYVRGPRRDCITVDKCPKKSQLSSEPDETCPQNEEYNQCDAYPACQKNCTNYDQAIPCPEICYPGCVCKEGYVRSAEGKCIRIETCPKREKPECPKNSHFDRCGANPICQKNCTNYQDDIIPCPLSCVPGCVCDQGFVRGPHRDCITVDKCPKKSQLSSEPECSEFEKYTDCDAYPDCQKTCLNYDKPIACPKICERGCICIEGYVRSLEGKCIPVETCPRSDEISADKCPPHSHFDRCHGNPLCQKNCTNYDKPIPCTKNCVPGCVCDDGFVRGPLNHCIPREKCPVKEMESKPKKCPKNMHHTDCLANPICQKNCTNYNKPIPCPLNCVEGCVCDKGFVLGPKKTCIQVSKCPKKNEVESIIDSSESCGENEVESECDALPACQKNCTNYDKPIPCPHICRQGCICKDGYVRSKEGKCIPVEDCPATERVSTCGENAYFSDCEGHPKCQETCRNHGSSISCPKICVSGCTCEKGFVRDARGHCIAVEDCHRTESSIIQDQFPKICKRDEVFSLCVSPCPDDCDNIKDPDRKCNLICLPIPGCVCKKGTIRGPEGNCIKKEQCPGGKKPSDCKELEYYSTCGPSCPDNCTNYNVPDRDCLKVCSKGCFCKQGYVRGPDDSCILHFDCENQGSPSWNFDASKRRSSVKANRQSGSEDDSSSESRESSEEDQSPLSVNSNVFCPVGEHFDKCAAHISCQKNCTNYDKDIPCVHSCVRGCVCDEGLVRKSYPLGRCIKPEQCPKGNFHSDVAEPEGCPNEELCTISCVALGRRYGVCTGPNNRRCVCY